ncbi:hypothetical protein [Mesorhizobium sp.]|uniref:hypothetical protein n=1 Tax=Mesorhizobium sp. TaxID=1871066 RepID=UPI000FEA6287|nr:hypothetical protein [Mesorhizobium sp.]RWM29793.1 MAG: hypothetical protein EOR75_31950 [Mesorhizobium sp.]TJV47691.1 MAG: hypothetical protein E5Y01_31805 [Mesorhizobium sp.]
MKNPFKRSSRLADLKDQLTKFEAGLLQLQKRRDVVSDILEQGRGKRRDFIRDNPGAETPAEIRHAISIAEIDAKGTDEEITEYHAHIQELRSAIDQEGERVAREEEAARLEAIAKSVDAAGAELKAALASVAKVVSKIEAEIPTDVVILDLGSNDRPSHRDQSGPATPSELVAMIVAEGLAHQAPQLFEMKYGYESYLQRFFDLKKEQPEWRSYNLPGPAHDAVSATRFVISNRLRAQAEAIRAGDAVRRGLATAAE